MEALAHVIAERVKGAKPARALVEGDGTPDSQSSAQPETPTLPDGMTFQAVDVSPRAKLMRSIVRIADAYGWHSAIVYFLETKGVAYMSDLTDPQLEDLLDRMEGYVDAAEVGASLEDYLPAT